MSKVAQFFGGIDLHEQVVQLAVIDTSSQVVQEKRWRIPNLRKGLEFVEYLKQWRQGGRFVVEAVGTNRWFVQACREAGLDIVVADPRKLGLKSGGKKTDRGDALELARRLMLGDVDKNARSYFPTEQEYGQRKLIRTRNELKDQRLKVENQIRGLLRAHKQDPLAGKLSSGVNLERLKQMRWPTPEDGLCLESLVAILEALKAQIEVLDGQIKRLAEAPLPRLLQERLPSVGPLTALTLMAEMGDWGRFKNARTVAKYPGLVPRVAQSGDRSHNGRLIKAGNRQLRWVLSQWAVRLLARDPLVKQWAQPKLKRMHKNKVRTALARKLLVGVWVVLTRGEDFSLQKCLAA